MYVVPTKTSFPARFPTEIRLKTWAVASELIAAI